MRLQEITSTSIEAQKLFLDVLKKQISKLNMGDLPFTAAIFDSPPANKQVKLLLTIGHTGNALKCKVQYELGLNKWKLEYLFGNGEVYFDSPKEAIKGIVSAISKYIDSTKNDLL